MSRFTGLSGMKSLEQLTGPNSGKRRRSSSSSPGHSISPGSIENLKRATGSNSGAADRKKSPSSSLLGHSIYPGSVENLKRDAGSNSGAADKKRKMTPQHSVASGSFANLKFTAAEKLVKEQASTKTGIDLANSKLKKPSIMEEKLQNAFNENAQLKVKQKEDEKLWRVVPTSSTKPLLDQITETFQQLNVQVEEKEQIEFVVELKTKEEQLDDHKAEITGSLADTESKLEAKKKYQRMLENKYMELSKNWNEMSQRHNQAIHKRIKYEVGKQEIVNLEKEKAYMEIKIAELKEEYQQQLLWVQEEHAVLVSSMQQEYAHKEMILISKHKELKLTQLQAEIEIREITVSLADTESKQEAKKNPSNIGDLFTEGCLNPDVEAFIFN